MTSGPGALFLREIHEQPAALVRIAGSGADVAAVASQIQRRDVRAVRIVAHGSSDNAASYGTYAFALLAGLTAYRDSISLAVYYGARVDSSDSCVVALSQSGRTPDVVEYVERARRAGTLTIAVTNDPLSPLAAAADEVLLLHVDERAVAATKTYSAELATLVLLAAHVGGAGPAYEDGLRQTGERLSAAIPQLEADAGAAAERLADADRMLVIARGPEFATARELALKLLETARITALALTATDFGHGPVAVLGAGYPVWAVAAPDAGLASVADAVGRANAAGATIVVTGPPGAEIVGAHMAIPVPEAPLPWLGPLLSIVPGQLFAGALARWRGLDPDAPLGLTKVTIVP